MTSWGQALALLAGLAAVVLSAGVGNAYLLGLRGVLAWAGAPVLGVSTLAIAAAVCGQVGVRWTLGIAATSIALGWVLSALLGRLVAAAPSWVPLGADRIQAAWTGPAGPPETRRDARAHPARRRRRTIASGAAAILGLVLGGGLILYFGIAGMGSPSEFPDSPDAVFHLGRIRDIIVTGNASSLTGAFYPSAFHQLADTALLISPGAGIVAAANLTSLLAAAILWPLGCLGLARAVLGPRPAVLVTAGLLSAAFPTFPAILMGWGVLWPNLLGTALIPGTLALVVVAAGLGSRGSRGTDERPRSVSSARPRARTVAAVGAVIATIGIAFAHPNATVSVLALFAVALLVRAVLAIRDAARADRHAAVNRLTLATAVLLLLGVAILVLVPRAVPGVAAASGATWAADDPIGVAVRDMVFGRLQIATVAWGVLSAAAVGLISLYRERSTRWIPVSWGVLVVLYVLDASIGGPIVALVTGYWYNDKVRLACLAVPLVLLVATRGVVVIANWVAAHLPRIGAQRPAGSRSWSVAIVLVLVVMTSAGLSQGENQRLIDGYYHPGDPRAVLLQPGDLDAFASIAATVPPGQAVAVDPATGGSLLWAFEGRPVLLRNLLIENDPDARVIAAHLNEVTQDPAVCPALRRLNMQWAIDANPTYWVSSPELVGGLHHLALSPGLELVGTTGRFTLYRITACGFAG